MVSVPLIPDPNDPTEAFKDDICVDPTTSKVTIYQWQSDGLVAFTTLDMPSGLDVTGTTVTVLSTLTFPPTGTILIDSERMTYTGVTSTSFTGVTRGAFGTTATTHANGAPVVNLNGSFVPATVLREGEGYFLWSCGNISVIDAVGQTVVQDQTHIPLSPGWSNIGNPYQSNVLLSNTLVRRYLQGGIDETVSFEEAVNRGWVTDSLYLYNGATNDALPFNGPSTTVMEPWKGYWLEVRDTDYMTNNNYQYELIVPKP
jgi:hypothetical protein